MANPAASLDAVARLPGRHSDQTLIIADVGRKALEQVESLVAQLLEPKHAHTEHAACDDARVSDATVHVRYMVDDVEAAIAFYTTHLGFTLNSDMAPAFADVVRGNLRLLLSGPTSSAGRPMPDGRQPAPGGWNRIHLLVDDLAAEVERLRQAGLTFRNEIVKGPGGSQILLDDPSGNPVELFQPR